MISVRDIAQDIVAREGGFVNDPDDPGGATNFGVTIHTMRRLGLDLDRDGDVDVADVRALDRDRAVDIFVTQYYRRPRIDTLPEALQASIDEKIDAALVETDEAKRDAMYAELQKIANDEAISIWLYQATGRFYVSKDVSGWFNHPLTPGLWYYALSKGQ